MKLKLLVIFSVGVFFVSATKEAHLWKQFKNKHGKSYSDFKEEQHRYEIFKENLRTINDHNKKYRQGEVSWYLKVTKFSDWTQAEFETWINGNVATIPSQSGNKKYLGGNNVNIPESFDWREQEGVVSEIKDQGDCGSCWAFSATGCLEGQYFLKNNKSISLSEQQLVDCSTNMYNEGCNGGNMLTAFEYAIKYGLQTEEYYPYIGKDGECLFDPTKTVIQPWVALEIEPSELTLASAVAEVGPISAGINGWTLYQYGGGIFNDTTCSTYMNHGILIVGYGVEDDVPFWIVKNSWGTEWGEDGYFRIVRHLSNSQGMCGLAKYLSYALLE